MKEVDCRKCDKCTGKSCKCYGNNATIAVEKCAKDNFKNYVIRSSQKTKSVLRRRKIKL